MKDIKSIAEIFYMGAWDLTERLCLLPQEILMPESEITAPNIAKAFKKSSELFLSLTGKDIPKEFHVEYDLIDTVVREEILPSLEILVEEWNAWDDLNGFHPQSYWQSQKEFADKCAYIANIVDLQIIVPASAIEKGLNQAYNP